jgi:uncharacterized iron-regulated membrane protein
MKAALSSDTVKRALSAHAAIGLLASALLYLVCVSGTLIVLFEEWQRVEQPDAPEMAAIAPDAVQTAVDQLLARERGKPPSSHLYVHLPTAALPRTTLISDHQAVHVRADGRIATTEQNAWSEFMLDLHYALNLPALIGMIVVGALGVAMLALSVTGVLALPRIFRDAFRLRARYAGGTGLADWHNRLSVWTLPFSIAIALTGAIIGLAAIAGYGVAARYYKGDLTAAYAPIFGAEGKPDKRAAGVPDVAGPLRYVATHFPDVRAYYVVVHDPLTAGQHVQVLAEHPRRLIYGENYNFDAQGRFHGTAGLADGALGQQIAASTYRLHFGNFGALPVKLAYLLFGTALCVVVATGTYIWLGKRRRRGLHEPRLRAAWDAVTWGVPIAFALSFVARLALGNDAPLTALFWISLAAILIGAIVAGRRRPLERWLRWAAAASVIGCVLAWLVTRA